MAEISPGAAFHFAPCLHEGIADILVSKLQKSLAAMTFKIRVSIHDEKDFTVFPTPHVQSVCVDGVQKLGLWLAPPPAAQTTAYTKGLANLNLLKSGETFSVFVSKPHLVDPVTDRFWDAFPRFWTKSGNPTPDESGKVHLRGFKVEFVSSNRVVTEVWGTYRATGPNVDFTLTLTDTLSTDHGRITWSSSDDLDIPGIYAWLLGKLFIGPLAFLNVAGVDLFNLPETSDHRGLGYLLAEAAPTEVVLHESGWSVKFRYSRVAVAEGHIVAGGTHQT